MNKIFSKIHSYHYVLFAVLLFAAITHGFNMFHFPYYENDEGTYMSQAWSLLTAGKLAPYTYWYDHAPGGWILIAAWTFLTGGFFTFGLSVNSGRVLMLVLHVASAFFVYMIAKKLSGRIFPGIIAVTIFSLSPLALYFQRRVLLDNIMTFWVLLAMWLVIRKPLKLHHVILSAVAFGVAVLTKENAIFFFPAFLYAVYKYSYSSNRLFGVVKWAAISLLIISSYFLYALLKGELFPTGFLGDTTNHVSLMTTLLAQAGRGEALPFWNTQSDFYINLVEWIKKDAFVIYTGIGASILSILLSFKVKALRIPMIFTILFWIFLLRGKLVIDFYVIPLIPFLALSIAMVTDFLANAVARGFDNIGFAKRFFYYPLMTVILLVFSIVLFISNTDVYLKNETSAQIQGYEWIKKNVTKDKFIAIDSFALVDLKANGYSNAEWFWKVWEDPEVQQKFENNWKKIDYLFVTHEMMKQMKDRKESKDVLKRVYKNSFQMAYFVPDKTTFVDFTKLTSTNGDWSAVYQLLPDARRNLYIAGKYYRNTFITPEGQVIDTSTQQTTSEGQSYALLRSVWTNDKTTFDVVWTWTQDHLQYRNEDKLFSWLWQEKVIDSASAADSDQDIALALLFAYKKWGDYAYLKSSKIIINDIWKREIVRVDGRYIVISGTGATRADGYLVNPSYFSPATYRIFAEVDSSHPWVSVANDSYIWLNQINNKSLVYIPSNWVLVGRDGTIQTASKYIARNTDTYGYDAFRTSFRVALDAKWFASKDAEKYLIKTSEFYKKEWRKNKNFYATYTLNGNNISEYGSTSTNAGPLTTFSITDPTISKEVYFKLFESKFNDDGYWADKNNYYDQNWAWFGTAFYYNQLTNLWDRQELAREKGLNL